MKIVNVNGKESFELEDGDVAKLFSRMADIQKEIVRDGKDINDLSYFQCIVLAQHVINANVEGFMDGFIKANTEIN